ncbi:MAG: hypothetical protein IBJ03_04340 [Gemmatimonadaceae bacterium]|nr:hypothetical protein [Gemmatimonadaceae bacterium]
MPDDCATQEDLNALESLVAAIDIEIYGQEQLIQYGGGCDTPCDPEMEMESSVQSIDNDHSLHGVEYDQPNVGWNVQSPHAFGVSLADPCGAPSGFDVFSPALVRSSIAMADCTNDAIQAGFAVFGWVGAKYAAHSLVMSVLTTPPPVKLVVFTVGGVLTAGWAAASSLNSWYNCRQSNVNVE